MVVWLFGSGSLTRAQVSRPDAAPFDWPDIPAGIFRDQLEALPPSVRAGVRSRVDELEVPIEDLQALRIHPRGELFYICEFTGPESSLSHVENTAEGLLPLSEGITISGPVSIASPPAWHSRPGSTNILFLDFNGAVVSNTAWNSYPDFGLVSAWDCRPYSIDADETTFSVAEQQAMLSIWERVAEDYAPFDIDVTTEQPSAWNRHTGHVLITPGKDKNGVSCPHDGAGGIAFVDVFGIDEYSYDFSGESYSPAWVLNYESAGAAEYEAEAASHEMGHNLALSHDGTRRETYYGGHENGSIGWGPIMGTGYNRDVSQWSKGDYTSANNFEDDLAIISARLNYRLDDFADDRLAADFLSLGPTGSVHQIGVVERNTDEDVFCFTASTGPLHIEVSPYRDPTGSTWGGNLDVILELYDAAGQLIATNNPALETRAELSEVISGGVYYLHIRSTGVGDPLNKPSPYGYVQYGSLGQYTITGNISIDPDLDGDGLPNIWEAAFFGGSTNAIVTADDDGDGSDNWSEYISGYDPTNVLSFFSITNFSAATDGTASHIVQWETITGRVYGVSWTDQLSNAFINISGDLPYPSGSYTDTVERAGSGHFYRLDVRLNP